MNCNFTRSENSNGLPVQGNEIKQDMELRTKKRRRVEGTKGKKKLKCHFCRNKKTQTGIVICLNYSICHHAFCYDCITKYFKNKEKRKQTIISPKNWVCFTCRGLCRCERCKLDLIKELSILNQHNLEDNGKFGY